jgi:hypothetical protein
MSKRPLIKTTIKEVVDYWSGRVSECGLSVDWSEAETHCWRCGCEKNLQRCHIIPDALDGKDEASNIVLLCSRCHAEGPNVTDPEIMWDWIRAYGVPFYETFWCIAGMQEYKFIYHKNVTAEINDILNSAGISKNSEEINKIIKKNLRSVMEKISVHFGQPSFNSATMAGLYRMMLKDMAKSFGVCFPIKEDREKSLISPWWLDV